MTQTTGFDPFGIARSSFLLMVPLEKNLDDIVWNKKDFFNAIEFPFAFGVCVKRVHKSIQSVSKKHKTNNIISNSVI